MPFSTRIMAPWHPSNMNQKHRHNGFNGNDHFKPTQIDLSIFFQHIISTSLRLAIRIHLLRSFPRNSGIPKGLGIKTNSTILVQPLSGSICWFIATQKTGCYEARKVWRNRHRPAWKHVRAPSNCMLHALMHAHGGWFCWLSHQVSHGFTISRYHHLQSGYVANNGCYKVRLLNYKLVYTPIN